MMILPGTSVHPNIVYNFIGESEESDVCFVGVSLFEPPYTFGL